MIKVSVMYPHQPDARFDMAYYRDKHMPMLKEKMGAACLSYSIDQGIGNGVPGQPPVYVAVANIHAESLEAFQAAFGPHIKAIMADVPNYTDIKPVMQISEVVADRS